MAAFQQGAKRQKVRETRENDYFQGIDKMEYNNMAGPGETTRYRFYNSGERLQNKTMEEWLKYSVSLTHFTDNGSESHGRLSLPCRPWDDRTASIDNHKRCVKALFDFCTKLGVKYWTAFDSDLVPFSESWDESRAHWDEIVEYVAELNQRYHMKLLWVAPDLHSHPRYNMLGGVTISNEVDQFDTKNMTLMMKCIIDQGCAPPSGINLKLSPRGDGDVRETYTTHVTYIDAAARGLRLACNLQREPLFSKHLQQRYSTYYSGFGSRLVSQEISIEECEEYHKKNHHSQSEVGSSKCEHLELAFQRYLDTSDHI